MTSKENFGISPKTALCPGGSKRVHHFDFFNIQGPSLARDIFIINQVLLNLACMIIFLCIQRETKAFSGNSKKKSKIGHGGVQNGAKIGPKGGKYKIFQPKRARMLIFCPTTPFFYQQSSF